ncbi:MAG: hypothetical protein NTX56_04350 [Proteobacteria bacterium]|nr:hypothetical protein [Pseudomonadota bacterium]
MNAISYVERVAGKRASFKVYYRRKGKMYFDVMWAAGTDEAAAKFQAFAREFRWTVEVVSVKRIDPV